MSDLKMPKVVNGELVVDEEPAVQQGPAPRLVYPKMGDTDKIKVKKSAREQLRELSKNDNAASMARLRGLTFGLSDRAVAGVKSLVGPETYEQELGAIQKERDAYREDSPIAAYGNELVAGLVTGGPISAGIKKLAGKVAPGLAQYARQAGLLPAAARVAAPVAEAGMYGEVAAQAEKPYGKVGTNLGQGALYGAAAGGALMAAGKGLGIAGKAAGKVGERAALALGAGNPEKFARKRFVGALQQENMTPEEVLEAAKFLRGDDVQLQGPSLPGQELPDLRTPVRVADVLPRAAKNVVKKGARASERAAAELAEMVANRNAEQGMRLQGHVDATLSDDVNSTAALEKIKADRAQAAGPHYEQAYAVGTVRDPSVDHWLKNRKVNAKLFEDLRKNLDETAAADGSGNIKKMKATIKVFPDGEIRWEHRPSIEDLDTIKKHLDSRITNLWDDKAQKFREPKRGLNEPDAYQLMEIRDELVGMVDKLTPDGQGGSHYANARKAFADDTELMEAQRAGMSMVRTRPEDVAKMFDKFSHRPELQQQYRAGVASAVKDMLDRADTEGGAKIVRKLWGTPGMQKKLEYVMANESTEQVFRRNMAAEKAFTDTQRELVPRSGGADNLLADAEGFSLPLALGNAATGRFGSAMNHLGRFASGLVTGVSPKVGDNLADIAMMSPEQYSEWLAKLVAQQKKPGAKLKRGVRKMGKHVGKGTVLGGAAAAGKIPHDDIESALFEEE